jgi:hypothetical protein
MKKIADSILLGAVSCMFPRRHMMSASSLAAVDSEEVVFGKKLLAIPSGERSPPLKEQNPGFAGIFLREDWGTESGCSRRKIPNDVGKISPPVSEH